MSRGRFDVKIVLMYSSDLRHFNNKTLSVQLKDVLWVQCWKVIAVLSTLLKTYIQFQIHDLLNERFELTHFIPRDDLKVNKKLFSSVK